MPQFICIEKFVETSQNIFFLSHHSLVTRGILFYDIFIGILNYMKKG